MLENPNPQMPSKAIPDRAQNPFIATDSVIFHALKGKLYIPLLQLKHPPYQGMWKLIGGLISLDQSIESSVIQQIENKTNIQKQNFIIDQVYTFGEVNRDIEKHSISIVYLALTHQMWPLKNSQHDMTVKWFPITELPPLAYDHEKIIKFTIGRLQAKVRSSNIIQGLLPEEFTLTELQQVYETVLDKTIDKRNFRKKISSMNIVESLKKKKTGMQNRPAELYRFISKQIETIELFSRQ
ncbi:MAG: NUDIX hydrolase [Parcubacteria group bacterium Gr01-1014_18]|nr:MAG: NUDIX hydrolase [Parcubacteria group bacterium Greene0416_36]TSC81071.1 MAG: NUDIX hydrolase [Parcubacteria group bacterium Gr01-1014_18]TSC98805.1 MAG: NUDIX hydrolase [Parcubacteria group bacterium Greene1014_20]TSD06715.1 MAG: NUDIX hydrolase [Parcubacteria group bacterium Greene0714_2]